MATLHGTAREKRSAGSNHSGKPAEACPSTAKLIKRLRELPPFPARALRALELLALPELDVERLTRVISADPIFAAETLRLVNSSLFGRRRPIAMIAHAVTMLGRDRLSELVLATALRMYRNRCQDQKAYDAWWRHSVACALLADGLSDLVGEHRTQAYAAGLLHDIGRLGLLMLIQPSSFLDMLSPGGKPPFEPDAILVEETARWGFDHCEIGLLLVGQWRLPEEIAAVAALHHLPPDRDECWNGALSLTALIHDACQLAAHSGFATVSRSSHWSIELMRSRLPPDVAQNFELDLGTIQKSVELKLSRF